MAAQKKFERGDVYAADRKGNLPIGQLGSLKTASKERLRAKITGSPVDEEKVGACGDVLVGGRAIADFLNSLISPVADGHAEAAACEPATSEARETVGAPLVAGALLGYVGDIPAQE